MCFAVHRFLGGAVPPRTVGTPSEALQGCDLITQMTQITMTRGVSLDLTSTWVCPITCNILQQSVTSNDHLTVFSLLEFFD